LRELEESRRSWKRKKEQKVEEGSQETNGGRGGELMGNESKYHRRDASTYSIESRTGDESNDYSDLEGGEAIRQKGRL
jgi:hypothetical protein